MGKAKPFLFGTLLGTSLMFMALQYHVLRTHDGVQLVPRIPQHSLGLAWADIRHWSASQWTDRPELARALLAHGSGSLISQSVTEQLAESVGAESATLDQLRSLLNRSSEESSPRNGELFRLPEIAPLQSADPPDSDESDEFTIPFPRAAQQSQPEDPFRVARTRDSQPAGPGSVAKSPVAKSPVAGSAVTPSPRAFTAADILNAGRSSLPESARAAAGSDATAIPAERPTSPPSVTAAASAAVRPVPATQKAVEAAAGAIFGDTGAPLVSSSAAAAVKPDREGAPFEEVATDLESRARAALSRAQSTLSKQTDDAAAAAGKAAASAAAEAASGATSSATQFVRDQLPAATSPLGVRAGTGSAGKSLSSTKPGSAAADTESGKGVSDSLRALREGFDPFLE